jgi:hypothetical protein
MRLLVVHEKYWLAILHKDELVEFYSSKQPMLLEAGQCLLFALAMRHRRNGQDSLVLARVLEVGLLDVDRVRETFPRESDDCNLADLAVKWGVTSVRCIVLVWSINTAPSFTPKWMCCNVMPVTVFCRLTCQTPRTVLV